MSGSYREAVGMQHGGRLYIRIRAGVRRFWKRLAFKGRRRQERADVENAPTKAKYSGYID